MNNQIQYITTTEHHVRSTISFFFRGGAMWLVARPSATLGHVRGSWYNDIFCRVLGGEGRSAAVT